MGLGMPQSPAHPLLLAAAEQQGCRAPRGGARACAAPLNQHAAAHADATAPDALRRCLSFIVVAATSSEPHVTSDDRTRVGRWPRARYDVSLCACAPSAHLLRAFCAPSAARASSHRRLSVGAPLVRVGPPQRATVRPSEKRSAEGRKDEREEATEPPATPRAVRRARRCAPRSARRARRTAHSAAH